MPEFLALRFNVTTQRVQGVVFALASLLIAGINLYALGLVLEALLGWPMEVAVPVSALVVLSYTFLGGLSAAIYNEVLQFFVIMALLIPLTVAGLARVGGWSGLVEKVTASPGGADQLSAWPGTTLTEIANPMHVGVRHRVRARVRAVLRLLDDELRRGAARDGGKGHQRGPDDPDHRRVPQGAAAVCADRPGRDRRCADPAGGHPEGRRETDITYNNVLSLLMKEVLPNGVLGVAIAGLLAAFMAGMAANVSSFNTVVTYDLWQD